MMAEVLHAVQGTAQSAASTIPANTSLQPGDYSVSPGHMRSQFCGILLLPGRDRSANNRFSVAVLPDSSKRANYRQVFVGSA